MAYDALKIEAERSKIAAVASISTINADKPIPMPKSNLFSLKKFALTKNNDSTSPDAGAGDALEHSQTATMINDTIYDSSFDETAKILEAPTCSSDSSEQSSDAGMLCVFFSRQRLIFSVSHTCKLDLDRINSWNRLSQRLQAGMCFAKLNETVLRNEVCRSY